MEDDHQADDLGADGPDELRLHAPHVGGGRNRLGLRDYGRRPPLRLDLLRGGETSIKEGGTAKGASLPRLAYALRLSGVCGGAEMDEKESGPVGEGCEPD